MELTEKEWFKALSERHGEDLQKRLSATTVAVCGLGGLGSVIAVSLARAGIGKLILTDFDRVDISNLNRQQYKRSQVGMLKTAAMTENILEISPYIKIEAHAEKLCEENAYGILHTADIVCEAFDDAREKAMLTDYVLTRFPDKYLVAASGMAGLGSSNTIKTRRVTSRFYLCGDLESDVETNGTLFSSRVMLCAAHQAHTVIRIIAGIYDV